MTKTNVLHTAPAIARMLAIAIVTSAFLLFAMAIPTRAATPESNQTGFTSIANCIADNQVLLVAIVIDESGSLLYSDPNKLRIGAVESIIDSLADLALSDERLTIEASVATFGMEYHPLLSMQAVAPNRSQIQQTIQATLAAGPTEDWTNYLAALQGAQNTLNQRANSFTDPCKAIIWFTDGRLDIQNDPGLTNQAWEEICRPNGLIDGIRTDGISVLTFSLFDANMTNPITPAERARLDAIAVGVGAGGDSCGTLTLAQQSPGVNLSVADASELRVTFATIVPSMVSRTEPLTFDNIDGSIEIPVNPIFGSFQIILEVLSGSSVTLHGPAERGSVDLIGGSSPDQVSISGVLVEWTNRDGLMSVVVTGETEPVAGIWVLEANPNTVKLIKYIPIWNPFIAFVPLEPTFGMLTSGELNTVYIGPMQAGSLVDLTDYLGDWDFTVQYQIGNNAVSTATVIPYPDPENPGYSFEIDLRGITQDQVLVQMAGYATASASVGGEQVQLGPSQTFRQEYTAWTYGIFPTLETLSLDFGRISAGNTVTRQLAVTGTSNETELCVFLERWTPPLAQINWVNPPANDGITLVVDSNEMAVDEQDGNCIVIPPNGHGEVTFDLEMSEAAQAILTGALPISFRTVLDGNWVERDAEITITALLERAVDEPVRWALAGGLTLGAFLLAWALAQVSREISDRYTLGTDTKAIEVPIRLSPTGAIRANASGKLGGLISVDDANTVGAITNVASFAQSGLQFDRAGAKLNPWQDYKGRVRADDGQRVVVGGDGYEIATHGSYREAPFAAHRVAYFIADDAPQNPDGTVNARLVVLIPSNAGTIRDEVAEWNTKLAEGSLSGGPNWEEIHRQLVDTSDIEQGEQQDHYENSNGQQPTKARIKVQFPRPRSPKAVSPTDNPTEPTPAGVDASPESAAIPQVPVAPANGAQPDINTPPPSFM